MESDFTSHEVHSCLLVGIVIPIPREYCILHQLLIYLGTDECDNTLEEIISAVEKS